MRSSVLRGVGACTLLLLAACATDAIKLAPADPAVPWAIPAIQPPTGMGKPGATSTEEPVTVEPGREYNLPQLIDLAQRSNPKTHAAWEQARQAALAVGLVESTYLPQLSAEVLAGFQHTPSPIPPDLIPRGYFTANTREVLPTIALKWLLFDFGGRAGAETAARENAFVANVAFTGAHQKLIFAVSRDYYALGAARGKRHASEQALKTAALVQEAVEARRKSGVATVVEEAQAGRQTAQARFNLERATGAEHAAYESLINSIGIAPSFAIDVADSSTLALPAAPDLAVEQFVQQALSSRPDVIASLGKIRAAEALLQKERASHRPTVDLVGQVYQNVGDVSIDGGTHYSVNQPGGNILAVISLPLFDGGVRDARIAIARSELERAEYELEETRDTAVKQVRDAYDSMRTGIAEHAAASAVVEASQTAYDAALDAYRHGVGTYTSVINEQNALAQARSDQESAHADVLTATCALALSTGSLLSGGIRQR